MLITRRVFLAASAVTSVTIGGAARATPDGPVKLVVPFAPGGATDIVARTIAGPLADRSGRPFVVENAPGAGGQTGTLLVAKAPQAGLRK